MVCGMGGHYGKEDNRHERLIRPRKRSQACRNEAAEVGSKPAPLKSEGCGTQKSSRSGDCADMGRNVISPHENIGDILACLWGLERRTYN